MSTEMDNFLATIAAKIAALQALAESYKTALSVGALGSQADTGVSTAAASKKKTVRAKAKRRADGVNGIGLDERVEKILKADELKVFSASDIGAMLNVDPRVAGLALGRLKKKNRAVRNADGGYQAWHAEQDNDGSAAETAEAVTSPQLSDDENHQEQPGQEQSDSIY